MGRTVLILLILLTRGFVGFCQSVTEKTREIIKNNKPRSLYSIPVGDGKRALLICLHRDSAIQAADVDSVKLITDTLAKAVRDSAMADSVGFYLYMSIFYKQDGRSELDEKLTFTYYMNDRIFSRREKRKTVKKSG